MATREWLFKRNCSISPRQLLLFYISLCSVSMMLALYFTFIGAWYVLAFSLLEMMVVGFAFIIYARHATDRERIVLASDGLTIELVECENTAQIKLDPRSVSVICPLKNRALVQLSCFGQCVEVGRFLSEWKRREFAGELTRELQSVSSS